MTDLQVSFDERRARFVALMAVALDMPEADVPGWLRGTKKSRPVTIHYSLGGGWMISRDEFMMVPRDTQADITFSLANTKELYTVHYPQTKSALIDITELLTVRDGVIVPAPNVKPL